jgi:hypothetical protein
MGCAAQGIHGHYALLTAEERNIQNEKALPRVPKYDLSWVLDENL